MKFSFIVLIFLGLMAAWLGFGDRGFIHLYRKEKDRRAYLERIREVEQENQELLEEIKRLHEDKEYLESVARKELGLIKEDEILYRFSREEKDHESSESAEK